MYFQIKNILKINLYQTLKLHSQNIVILQHYRSSANNIPLIRRTLRRSWKGRK